MAFCCNPEGQLSCYYVTHVISRESETGTKYQLSHEQILAGASFEVKQIQGLLADAIVNNFQIDQVVWQAISPITLPPLPRLSRLSQCFFMCS